MFKHLFQCVYCDKAIRDVSWALAWCRQAMRAAGRLPDLWRESDTRRRESGPILGHFRERQEVQPAGSPHEGNSLRPTNVSSEKTFGMVKKLPLKIENIVWTMAPSILFCPARSTIETLATNTLQLRELPSLLPVITTVCWARGTYTY